MHPGARTSGALSEFMEKIAGGARICVLATSEDARADLNCRDSRLAPSTVGEMSVGSHRAEQSTTSGMTTIQSVWAPRLKRANPGHRAASVERRCRVSCP